MHFRLTWIMQSMRVLINMVVCGLCNREFERDQGTVNFSFPRAGDWGFHALCYENMMRFIIFRKEPHLFNYSGSDHLEWLYGKGYLQKDELEAEIFELQKHRTELENEIANLKKEIKEIVE